MRDPIQKAVRLLNHRRRQDQTLKNDVEKINLYPFDLVEASSFSILALRSLLA